MKSFYSKFKTQTVLTDHISEQIHQTIQESFLKKAFYITDKSTSYIDIADFVKIHVTEKSNKETTTKTLKWIHIAISNVKINFLWNLP